MLLRVTYRLIWRESIDIKPASEVEEHPMDWYTEKWVNVLPLLGQFFPAPLKSPHRQRIDSPSRRSVS